METTVKPRPPLNIRIGALIKECREKADLTQRDLAAAANVTQAFISLLETGGSKVSLDRLACIASVLLPESTTPLADIIRQAEDPNKKPD